jgi:predicted esterase
MAPVNRSALIFIHDQTGSPGDWSPFQTQLRSSIELFPVRYLTPDAPRGAYLDTREAFLQAGATVRAEIEAQCERGIPLTRIGVVAYGAAATLVLGLAAAGELAGVAAVYAVAAGPLPPFLVEALQASNVSAAAQSGGVGRLAQYHGADDSVVALATAQETERILTAAQIPAYELMVVDNARHALSGTIIAKIIAELPSVFGVQS